MANKLVKKIAALGVSLFFLFVFWLLASVFLNHTLVATDSSVSWFQFIHQAWNLPRPILPSPQQIFFSFFQLTFLEPIFSSKSLIYHAFVTLSSTLVGFFMGLTLGILLSIALLYSRTLKKSLMPWVVISQTLPIISLAPMLVVVFGAIGWVGIFPKAVISAYLSFFPITISMNKGLQAMDPLHFDLVKTYNMNSWEIFCKIRLPTSLPYFFISMKIALSSSLVGAIVAELPTGAQAGLGARLLLGSYYGQTVQIWATLLAIGMVATGLLLVVKVLEKKILFWKG